jgi:acetylornithine/N-succinyldiaminopimelate aminotransferase
MSDASTKELFSQFVVPNYGRYDLVLDQGSGVRVWDESGKEYLDFGAGIAVSVLGHAHPRMVAALSEQSQRLIHTSNLYFTRPQGELARKLVEVVGAPGKVFFSNSGAEANEAAIKIARKFGNECVSPTGKPRHEIITFERSFHGRTMAGISATAQAKVKVGFEPLLGGFRHVQYNDLTAARQAVTDQTVAILLEAIQGEGGIYAASPEFLTGLRELCDEHDLLLMLDEIQCGLGRVGEWCGWRALTPELVPDVISWAKGIGGGFPLGATWFGTKPVRRQDGNELLLCDLLQPGSHGTTYGGTPLACSVSLAVLNTIESEGLLARARELGALAVSQLRSLNGVKEVRGLGLMLGIELDSSFDALASGGKQPASIVVQALAENGLLTAPAGPRVIRWLPPLIVEREHIETAVAIMGKTLAALVRSAA